MRSAGLEPIVALGQLDQAVDVAAPGRQYQGAGDLSDPGGAGDDLAIEPLFLVDPLGSLQLVGDV